MRIWVVDDLLTPDPPADLLANLKKAGTITRKGKTYRVSLQQATDSVMTQLERLNGLTELELGDCDMLTEGDRFCAHEKPGDSRIELNRTKNATDAWLSHLKDIPRFQGLTVFQCPRITDTGLAHLTNLTNLEALDLFQTSREQRGPRSCQEVDQAALPSSQLLPAH